MRVKRGITSRAKHRKVLRTTKGFRMTKRRLIKVAREAHLHAGEYAFAGRKLRKRDFRTLWIMRISEALKSKNINYSTFINLLKKSNIQLDRKILAHLVLEEPDTFFFIVDKVKNAL